MWIRRLRERAYGLLEVAAPGDRAARIVNLFIASLVVANAAAQVAAPVLRGLAIPHLAESLVWGRRISIALFAVEYLWRMWSSGAGLPDEVRFRTLRSILRPLALVDLAVILSALLRSWVPFDLRLLRLLRLPPLYYLIRRTWLPPEQPPDMPGFREQMLAVEASLAKARGNLSQLADEDIAEVRGQGEEAATQIRLAQRRWMAARRQEGSSESEAARADADVVAQAMDRLLSGLLDEGRLESLRQRHSLICSRTAGAFHEVSSPAARELDLKWQGKKVFHPVPLAAIGNLHFGDLEQRQAVAFTQFGRGYKEGLQAGVEGTRAAVQHALDQAVTGQSPGSAVSLNAPADIQLSFTRALNRCRDLEETARANWEGLRWELESEHEDRLQRVETDAGRYGRLEFHLGRLSRWSIRRAVQVWHMGQRGVALAVPAVGHKVAEAYRLAGEALLPALRWLGVSGAAPTEVLEALDQASLRSLDSGQLPPDYRTHFTFLPLSAEDLAVGFDRELGRMDQAVERWEHGLTSSFVVYGERGSGKTTLLNIARERLFDDGQDVVHADIEQRLTTAGELLAYLGKLLGIEARSDLDSMAEAILSGPRRAIILEGCHNLFVRQIGGLDAIRHLLWLVARTNHHVLWGLCLERNARHYLAQWLPFDRLFHFDIPIRPRGGRELRTLIMQRHNRSGCRLRYVLTPDLVPAVKRRVKRWRRPDEPAVQEALTNIFFDELAEVAGENCVVAFFYWLRSIRPTEGDTYEIQPMEPLNLDLVRNFTLDQAFLLAAVLQHDNLTASELAAVLDMDLIQTRLELEILANQSILELRADIDRFRINPVALGSVSDMLQRRNLVH